MLMRPVPPHCAALLPLRRSNAGTVEFIVDKHGRHYYMETNPRWAGLCGFDVMGL